MSAPINIALCLHSRSLSSNQLCGLDYSGEGTYTAKGITALCEALKGSAMTSLKCAARSHTGPCSLLCQRPLTSRLVARRSIAQNNLTNDGEDMSGVFKLVETLPQTKLTSLKCVPRLEPRCSLLCQGPLTFAHTSCGSLDFNRLHPEGGAAIAEGLKGNTTLKELRCAAAFTPGSPHVSAH